MNNTFTKQDLIEMVRKIFKEEYDRSTISSFTRQLVTKFNLKKIDQERSQLQRKSDIPKIQEYLRNNGWIQSRSDKDNWTKDNMRLRLDSTFGILKVDNK